MLADVRRNGFAISNGQIELIALSIAAPVHGPDESVLAALSVVVPAEDSDAYALLPAVRTAARGTRRETFSDPVPG